MAVVGGLRGLLGPPTRRQKTREPGFGAWGIVGVFRGRGLCVVGPMAVFVEWADVRLVGFLRVACQNTNPKRLVRPFWSKHNSNLIIPKVKL